jgi:phosphatidylserine decarboxylase
LRRRALGVFARMVGADLDEPDRELTGYASLGEFFARRLRPGARPIAGGWGAVVAPADGLVTAVGIVEHGTLIQAKGQMYSLSALVADDELARRLDGGSYVTVYLSPRDYHRVHSPVDGELVGWRYVPGSRWPVGPAFADRVSSLYTRNERAIARVETDDGPVAVAMVGAMGVGNLWLGHIQTSTRRMRTRGELRRIDCVPPIPIDRGDELGAFLLGSTVVVVFPRGAATLTCAVGDRVRCGERIGGAAGS